MIPETEIRWHVFYCKSRAEKRAFEELTAQGIKAYLPLMQVERVWSDRIKKVTIPMFSGYIFVSCNRYEISKVVQFSQIVAAVKTGGEYSRISDKEIELLKIVEQNGLYAGSTENLIKEGDLIEVTAGPLRGYQGWCLNESGQNYFMVAIEGINQTIKLKINKGGVKKV